MSELKRIPIKYIRDRIKRDYKQRDACYICGITENLELHHLYSISENFTNWCTKNKIDKKAIETVDAIEEIREKFYADEREYLDNTYLYTLCKKHHQRLHNIYGATYVNGMAPKIMRWIDRQKAKFS